MIFSWHQRNHLADVEARAAAKGNHTIMHSSLISFNASDNIGFNGIRAHFGKDLRGQACGFEIGHNGLNHGHCGQAGVSHKQGALDVVGLAQIGQILNTACTELDGSGKVEIAVW